MGFLCIMNGHKWNGCKCSRCGELRDEQHDWNGCTCRVCGRKLTRTELVDAVRRMYADWNQENYRRNFQCIRIETDAAAFRLVSQARTGLPESEADDVLLAWLLGLALDGMLLDGLGKKKHADLSYAGTGMDDKSRARRQKRLAREFWQPIREADPSVLCRFRSFRL